ncbi:MAG TPA: S9 family peptidase [Sedimentisphaerales bacterium]|jgi:dipeptidyl aminopeptidase/acylaminoacyl peptidase|nr:S9 family peptidase [Sedimentisphaerales bacterium]HNU29362.1 S9 family peptidase [Sedimentisphaerales bacterium]
MNGSVRSVCCSFGRLSLAAVFLCTLGVCAVGSSPAGERPGDRSAGREPYAYLFPSSLRGLTERLQRRGIEVHELREDVDLDVTLWTIERVVRDGETIRLEARSERQVRRFDAGTVLVKTGQKLDAEIRRLLNAKARKRPRIWELLDQPAEGDIFPVCRIDSYAPLTHGLVRPRAQTRECVKPITFETVYGPENRANFSGSPVGGLTWLDDGEHYLQTRDGRLYKVHATSGRSALFLDPNALGAGLRRLPAMRPKDAEAISRRTWLHMTDDRTAVLIDYENDLYYLTTDGQTAVRLTSTPQAEQHAEFDPHGKFVAFVREGDLYVVDVATQTERALTEDGGGLILNGQADWVYFEEILNRRWRMFWWSPDSSAIAFLRTDDTPVPEYVVVNDASSPRQVEPTRYPRAGEPNPTVKLGIVSVAGGAVRWVDLSGYTEGDYLVPGAGWTPDSERIYFFVQDRAQTWLDISTTSRWGGRPKRLLRETTEAWVEPPSEMRFLANGSLLLTSERTGWKHLYLYDKDGQLKHSITDGQWEVRGVQHVDEEGGWVYFTGTRDSPIAENLYRVPLAGGEVRRLTEAAGQHNVDVSPNGKYFIDSWSDANTPTQVALRATDGAKVRTLDTNPVYEREEYAFGGYEQFQIEMSDGFQVEASMVKPPDFDAGRKYPVWFTTYAGPHAPSISDSWQGGRTWDQMLTQMGAIVFHCDPRPASGKGACSAWTAYRQLGVQELRDIEESIRWLTAQPYVDAERIGMSGYSYGGFMTAYALTHSKLFAGGIAGAPPTDWRFYDSIYTERFMDTPQNNPDGYERTSVVKAAKDLHGQLLLVHGAIDDNVHIQNTFTLVDALQRADKPFQLMVYPQSRHGVGAMHYNRLTVDFIRTVLRLPEPASQPKGQ